jgi:hypothetical protein
VLELWGACVAQFLHSELPWTTCLNIGNSISTITAISKGRSIGIFDQPDPDKKKEKTKEEEGTQRVEVMGFPIKIKDDTVIVKGRPKSIKEGHLIRKFGEENFGKVKRTMSDALHSWKGSEDELDKRAFHMYEKFRPNVAKGQQGWGRKGELNLVELEGIAKK